MADDVAIRVDNVSKNFVLPHMRKNTVKSIFTSLFDSSNRGKSEVQHALKDVSFEIKKGEFFGIVGRNGSGKSTLLKMLAGIYQPTKGTIQVNGKLVPFIELGVGFNPELTGRENVYLNGALLGFDEKKIDAMYDDIVEFAELEKFMDQKLKNYSSGMQVRLAFSMAIRADADILLIDEVLAVGDADFQRKCFDYFKALKKNKKTVVFVSHDMNAVREYCDKALLINESMLMSIGSPDKIATKYFRMFTATSEEKTSEAQNNRWGNGTIRFTKVHIDVQKSNISFELEAIVYESIESANFGFTVKNAANESILGTNSQLKNKKIGPLEKNDTVKLEWSFPNILSTGTYSVDPAVISDNHVDVYDWWESAEKFKITKLENTPHKVSPNIDLAYSIINEDNDKI